MLDIAVLDDELKRTSSSILILKDHIIGTSTHASYGFYCNHLNTA